VTAILAIDPGKTGGLALLLRGRVTAVAMPRSEVGVVQELAGACSAARRASGGFEAWIEHVAGFAGAAHPGARMFNFGRGYGFICGVLRGLGCVPITVAPQRWQRPLGLGQAKDFLNDRAWKNALKAEAQRRFPHLRVTLKTADALLILDFASRQGRSSSDCPASVPGPAGSLPLSA
jgi:hypothetical protein